MSERKDETLKAAYEDRVRVLAETVAARERELKILSAVASRVHGEDDVQAILDIALDEILARLNLQTAWIFTGSEEDRKLQLSAHRGVAPVYLEEIRREGMSECLCPEVFWSGHRMQARNTTQCPRMPTIVEGLSAPVAHACIPLRFEKGSRGVLNVAARPGQLFTEDELRFLDTLGHQIGLAVERARHLRAERLRNQEARAMAAISKAIGGSLDVPSVLAAVGSTALEIMNADRVTIFLGNDPASLTVGMLSGVPHPDLRLQDVIDLRAAGAILHCRALDERATFAVDDWSSDERVNRELADRWGIHSGLLVPLIAHEDVLGLLSVSGLERRRWSEEHVDVAEALAAQAAMAIDNARLYEEAKTALQDLRDAQERIIGSEKMAVLGTFASGLAHEVRNPLNSISLQLTILERRINRSTDAGLGAPMQEIVSIIREEIQRLETLVGDFLLFSRTDRIQYRPADVEALIDDVMAFMTPEAQSARVRLRHVVVEPLPRLRVDAEKIRQVVMNLVRNAVEAMADGGEVVVETGISENRARIVITDDGPGLPDGVDVFQLFVTTKPKGTGLGLSIVQQIVLQHGGEIAADRGPQGGARFTITLPALPAEAPDEEAP